MFRVCSVRLVDRLEFWGDVCDTHPGRASQGSRCLNGLFCFFFQFPPSQGEAGLCTTQSSSVSCSDKVSSFFSVFRFYYELAIRGEVEILEGDGVLEFDAQSGQLQGYSCTWQLFYSTAWHLHVLG